MSYFSITAVHTRQVRTVESFMPTIFTELAVHEWDIRFALEPSPSLSPVCVPILIDRIPNRTRPWSVDFPAESISQGPIRYRFELTGPGARLFDLVVEDNIAHLAFDGDAAATVFLTCDSGTFALLMWKRISLVSAKSAGHVTAAGD